LHRSCNSSLYRRESLIYLDGEIKVLLKSGKIKKVVFLVVFMFLLVGAAYAEKEQCKNFDDVLEEVETDAEDGVLSSVFILGKMYQEGKCMKKDFELAHKWLSQAAAKGHAEAKFYLGLLYYDKGPKKDFVKALIWFKQAYQAGDTNSMYYMGEAYLLGKGVRKNQRQAEVWLKHASVSNNDPRAHYLIGYLYHKGIKRRQNYRKAFSWYVKSALLGYNEAHYKIASFYDRGIGVRRSSVKAYTWYSIAEKHGYKQQARRKNRLSRSLSADNIAKANKMIKRYMKTIDYPEYQ